MFGIENFMAFSISALLFIMVPGLDTAFVLNKSIGEGRRAGLYAALGINSGVLTHTLLGALGLTVLISKSEIAFGLIKYLGAIYVIYMGIIKLKTRTGIYGGSESVEERKASKSDFWSGFLANSLNPKVALFFLAFFPKFINASQIENPVPFILLGLTFACMGIIWYLSLSLLASQFSEKINSNPKSSIIINRLSGMVFILMGIHIIFG